MSWQGIEGQDPIVERFRTALARSRLASTFLFVGPAGVGKRTFADRLAQTLLCTEVRAAEMAPCGRCDSCLQCLAQSHPDLHWVEKPADRSSIPLSLLVGDDNHRMREGLCHDIALKPFLGGRKVAIIDDADDLNDEGANALLKTLEEPPPNSVLILIGTSAERQLPTIRSRAQVMRFSPLAVDVVASILQARGLVSDAEQARRLAGYSGGSLSRAQELADEELWAFRTRLFSHLASPTLNSVALARELLALVDGAGKDAAPRRLRARQAVVFAVDFYRQCLRVASGVAAGGDAELTTAVSRAAVAKTSAEVALACIDRSLEALSHINRNAHQATLLECWLDDLGRIVQSGHAVASYGEL
jgi:DNA polymerase-3 subunit delta'